MKSAIFTIPHVMFSPPPPPCVHPPVNARKPSKGRPVGANSEDGKATASHTRVTNADRIPQGPTNNLIKHHDQETQRSYADVVRNNRSAHSIELINKEY